MPRQSPENTPDRDEAPDEKGFFERVAAWLDSNNLEYADYPEGQFFSCATPATRATGGSLSMSARVPTAGACSLTRSIRCGCRKESGRWSPN